jgi:hypothetical protein
MASELRRPQARRMRLGRVTATTDSTNWSGLGGEGNDIEGAAGEWTVPAIEPSTSALYSASWVGVDGMNNTDLIQTGTGQDTIDGDYAWIEILPADEEEIFSSGGSPALVEPGDQIVAYVAETATSDVWTIYIEDSTQNWYFDENFSYDGPGQSAEWIEEAPTVGGEQSTPADFGTVDFSETEIYGDFGSSGTSWYSTDMDASNEIAMVNETGTTTLAMPSAPTPSSSGQSFSDTYVTVPGTPSDLVATAGVNSVYLSWQSPSYDGGTSIVGYYVNKYLSGAFQETVYVTTTSTTVPELTPGHFYSFSVAAFSAGNWLSAYTTTTPPVTPSVTLTQGRPSSATVSYGASYSGQSLAVTNVTGTVSYTEATSMDSSDIAVSSSGGISATASLTPGTYEVGGGDSDTSGDIGTWTFRLTVVKASQTVTFTAPSGGNVNGSASLSPTASSGLTVALSVDGTTTHDACSISGDAVRYMRAGSCMINANQAGNADYLAATQVHKTITIGMATTKVTLNLSATKVTYGDEQTELVSVTVLPQRSGMAPSGTVTIKTSATTLSVITLSSGRGWCAMSHKKLKPGSYRLVAAYSGSKNFKSSISAKETLTIAK